MRISFVEPRIVGIAREALQERGGDWESLFSPTFEPPPAPSDAPTDDWPRITEHVARAERVSSVARQEGLAATEARFGRSTHAIEVATVVAAAAHVDMVRFEMLQSLLSCKVDELIAYGGFITLLLESDEDPERVVRLYEEFCDASTRLESPVYRWEERVEALRDGLASLYVRVGRLDDAHSLFTERHESAGDLTAALAASRAFLAAGHTARSMQWLDIGAERADALDRPTMAVRLREKLEALRRRTC